MAIIKIRNAAIDLDAAEIPNLPATKITSGTFDNARISLDAAEIPNLDTAKITSGTIATARLGSGTANTTTFLRGDNTFAEAGGGKVLQVVQVTTTTTNTINDSGFQATSITANITPASSSNKVLVFASSTIYADTSTAQARATIYRGSTNLASTKFVENYNSAGKIITPFCMQFLDSPNTTSQTTYAVYGTTNSGNAVFNGPGDTTGVITLMEIGAW